MRILFVSNLYPPVARGGYEVECSTVAQRLAREHDVCVLTSSTERAQAPAESDVRRELALLAPNARGALQAPLASIHAADAARRVLAWQPDFIYVWNGSSVPQSALRVLADSGLPLAFRVCEHWFGALFVADQYLRELLPSRRGPARAAWAAGCRALNRLPSLRLDPTAPARVAISWNSQTLRRLVPVPTFLEPALERVCHSVPAHGDLYATVVREPAPDPEVLFVGRVTPFKGVEVAIEAIALLRTEYGIETTLVVAGPEEPAHGRELRRLAARLHVADSVRWLGPLAPEEIATALSRAHALIVPSWWDEPFPLVTIEGALAGVPLVASDVGGVSEGMHDEEHALLFGREDAAGAAATLARTLREPEATAERVIRARARAERFRLTPYLDAQEQFVLEAYRLLGDRREVAFGSAGIG
jgi:glycosyltransferase involved in cell wall biosynthesis